MTNSNKQITLGDIFDTTNKKRAQNGCNLRMNELFAEWLADHVTENSLRGDLARRVRYEKIKTTDALFPKWNMYETLSTPKRKST